MGRMTFDFGQYIQGRGEMSNKCIKAGSGRKGQKAKYGRGLGPGGGGVFIWEGKNHANLGYAISVPTWGRFFDEKAGFLKVGGRIKHLFSDLEKSLNTVLPYLPFFDI